MVLLVPYELLNQWFDHSVLLFLHLSMVVFDSFLQLEFVLIVDLKMVLFLQLLVLLFEVEQFSVQDPGIYAFLHMLHEEFDSLCGALKNFNLLVQLLVLYVDFLD